MKLISQLFIAALLILVAACSSPGEIGEACTEASAVSQCVDSAICTNEGDDQLTCQLLCEAQEDCPDGLNCNGISGGSLKSCQE
jgi:hypothetical protein